jgi:hypothetical protein
MARVRPARANATSLPFPERNDWPDLAGACSTAVCLNCDTALEISGIPEAMCRELGIKPDEDAVFIRLDAGTYRDGIRFQQRR